MVLPVAPEKHPWNLDFSWQVPSGPFRGIRAEQARQYDEQGYFLLEGAFDSETVANVIGVIDPFEANVTSFLRTQKDGSLFIAQADAITFSPNLVLQSDTLRSFCRHRVFQDLASDLIGPNVRLYWEQAVYKKPEPDRVFPWHQDNGYTYVEPQQYLTCWVALTDATVENGCPWVVPGAHREGTLKHWMTDVGWQCLKDAPGAVPVPVPAGGIAVFSSLTPHRTGPNETDAVRKSYIVQFAPDGAHVLREDPTGQITRDPQGDSARQFPILIDGNPPSSNAE